MSENKKTFSERTYHSIRIVVGLYLLYTDYSLMRDFNTMDKKYVVFFVICMIAFAAAGIALLFFSGKALIKLIREDKEQYDMDEPEDQDNLVDQAGQIEEVKEVEVDNQANQNKDANIPE